MTSTQKCIKYAAICFAIFLIVTIIYSIVSFASGALKITNIYKNFEESNISKNEYESYLDINLKYTKLTITKGETFSIDNPSSKIKINKDDNKIVITDNRSLFSKETVDELTIYIPSDYIFDIVNINSAVGSISINDLNTKVLDVEFGAGKAFFGNIKADKTSIETGAGKVEILNSELNDLDLELGIGESIIYSKITGKSKIECGIGKATINLESEDNTLEIEKGIGSIVLNNKEVSNDTKYGNGTNYLKVEGGIGKIIINTKKEGVSL